MAKAVSKQAISLAGVGHIHRVAAVLALLLAPPATGASAQEGKPLYDEHCASCHGLALEGQPDWMNRDDRGRLPAPPHDASGHTWHHSDRQLLTITRDGIAAIAPGYETDMPAFGDRLSDAEIMLIFDYIRSHWPERELGYQRSRSEADPVK